MASFISLVLGRSGSKKGRLILSGIVSLVALGFKIALKDNHENGYHLITIILMILATGISGLPIMARAISSLRYKIVAIDLLVTIAIIGAIFIGEYWEAAAVSFLFMLGEWLEARTIEKTRSSIKSLLDLAPVTARVKRNGAELEIPAEEVVIGDVIIIKPGEKIPADGKVIEGFASVNQAAITGESMPLEKELGSSVYSGTIVESGYIIIEAVKVGEDTTFAGILRLVEEAQDKKAKTQKFLERFSRYYTPGIILLSIAVYLITRDFRLALTLLVISCPGALVISAPVSIVAGIGNGAKHGVLVKGGEVMEKLGTVKAIAFDKTGTLTKGRAEVQKIQTTSALSETEILEIAAIGESFSEHPLAKAVLRMADAKLKKTDAALQLDSPENPEMIIGQGIVFGHKNTKYRIGNRSLFTSLKTQDGSNLEELLSNEESEGRTCIILGTENEILGFLSIADEIRPEAKQIIRDLKKLGLKKIIMLTGDNEKTAQAIAKNLGLSAVHAELLPADKVDALEKIKKDYPRVAMVGDGVNDAPALAASFVGIAMGEEGSDVAMETADIVLMTSDLQKLRYAMGLSRATVKNMRQNISFALAVAAFLLAGVLIKTVNLSLGMLVHEASVILVIVNAIRLLAYKERKSFLIST
ncbi:MAG TPA: cation-translocating P-type ATPase [Treponemataceae bacterium]|nr:cation-translocating P-type ATPase [Treponemataceae bacterium]HUH44132.1 cation-translocating P-type ATPase [Treponemataceae bacterium]